MRRKNRPLLISVILSTSLLCACATNSSRQPPVVAEGVKLTPLPASVMQDDSKTSATWQEKAAIWLQKLGQFSESATPK